MPRTFTGTLRHPRLVVAAALSVLLHALVLVAFREHVPARWGVTESRRALPIEATLRPDRSRESREESARPEVERSTEKEATRKLPRKRAAVAAEPRATPSEPADASAQGKAPPDSGRENSANPTIDLEAARRIAREADRSRERSLSELPPLERPQTESQRLGRAVAKAARPDCLTAHAGKGLFAVIFLIKDSIADTGCKW